MTIENRGRLNDVCRFADHYTPDAGRAIMRVDGKRPAHRAATGVSAGRAASGTRTPPVISVDGSGFGARGMEAAA